MHLAKSHVEISDQSARYMDFLRRENMPHSFMFLGAPGSLKELHAMLFAKEIIKKNDNNPHVEKKLEQSQHPDLRVLEVEPKASYHSIANIKKSMDEITLNPFESKVRVVVIFDADKMLPPAANALLKTLEEPVSSTVFILLGSSESSFLQTISSRCTKILFQLFTKEQIEKQLMHEEHVSLEVARVIAKYSFGSLDAAKSLLKQTRPYPQELFVDFLKDLDLLSYNGFLTKFDLFDKALAKDTNLSNEEVFEIFLKWIRDVYCIGACQSEEYLYFDEEKKHLLRQSNMFTMSFDEIVELLLSIKGANLCNVKLKSCIEALYLKLHEKST
ncbi:hypothetical protein COB11_00825 [Candidatus Aerophobetes bacterium]|uniref:DNA polymerase III subunit delta n=1 Tax=Aerophobetes bacterium TaxID=2030807 RepID=A0A2A4YM55_UNCAE|nr:MAG: hypothetical protein COB11_00825 [Candidatus Aerophobetes bacterium]